MGSYANGARITGMLDKAERDGALVHAPAGPLRDALNRRVARGTLVAPHPGHFARSRLWSELDPAERCRRLARSLARAHPDWVLAGPTAALIHGLYVPHRALARVTVVAGCNRVIGAVHAIDRERPPSTIVEGLRVTSLDQTAFDTMRALPFRDALGVADSLLRLTQRTPDQAVRRIAAMKCGHRGVRRVKETLLAADPRSENGGESYARAVMIEEGVQLPELQVEYRIPGSGGVHRVDFDWEHRVRGRNRHDIGELDGFQKLTDPTMTGGRAAHEILRAERNRESRLMAMGLGVIRFTFDDCVRTGPLMGLLAAHGIPGAEAALARWRTREGGPA